MLPVLMLGLLGACLLTVLLVHVLGKHGFNSESLVRTSYDLGALVLIERFGKGHETSRENLPPIRTNAEQQTNAPLRSRPLPEASPPTAEPVSSNKSLDPYAAVEAAVQGAWFGKAPLENLLEIDENVYTAMEALAGMQLDSIGDLSRYLSSWESAEMGDALPEGALHKLMGHLAEPIVGQHLEDLGIQVEMPDLSNQAGYDLILNGVRAVNVKTVTNAGALAEHFDKYPEIPVVVPGDMAGIPAYSIQLDSAESIEQLNRAVALDDEKIVLVDEALTQAEFIEHAEGVSDALLGNMDATGIPFITLALSGYREALLLRNKDTDVHNSVKKFRVGHIGNGGRGICRRLDWRDDRLHVVSRNRNGYRDEHRYGRGRHYGAQDN